MDMAINDADNRAIIWDKTKFDNGIHQNIIKSIDHNGEGKATVKYCNGEIDTVDMAADRTERNKEKHCSKVDWSNYPENKTPV